MVESDSSSSPKPKGFIVHLQGHVLLFEQKPAPQHEASAGLRLLFLAVVLEAVRLGVVRWFYPRVPLLILIPFLLACALLAVRFGAGLRLSQVGFKPWRQWNAIEKSYFVQVLIIANVVFPLILSAPLQRTFAHSPLMETIAKVFVPYLFFGFYQEVVYRGMLQSELVRRCGAFIGILAANILYTFGPLHSYYFASRSSLALPMFAAIFAIGLFFGIVFRRSGNLWIVAVIHGIGNAYIVGSIGPVR
jgi:membrane protease YdiL (CAAX protease family)